MSESPDVAARPPRGDRVHYYITGTVPPQYQAWAEKDIESRNWTRREWIKVLIIGILIIWLPSGPPPFTWSSMLWVGGVAILIFATMPWRRKAALRRIRQKPLGIPTTTGEKDQPDPMQSFYAKRR